MNRPPLPRRFAPSIILTQLVCAGLLSVHVAQADKLTDAEELFRRAKGLMAEKKDREACPLLEESHKLDPQMGTLLNLAICHENVGKLASAWGEFRAVEQQARAANRDDRVKLARDRAAKLEPRLSRVKIVVPADAKVTGLVVKVDGEAKGEPLWGGVAVDPGVRTIEASAPGKRPATMKVKVEEEGALVPVNVPKLEDEPVAKPPAKIETNPAVSEAQYASNRSRKTTGFIVGGVRLAALAAGGAFGVLAIMNDSDARSACPQPCINGSTQARTADDTTDRALVFANISNIALPVGLLALAVGGYLVLSAGPTEQPKVARAFVTPTLGGGGVGMRW